MADIIKISQTKVGRYDGCLCDRCGQYIQEVVTVEYEDGSIDHFGTTCFNKLWISERLWNRYKKNKEEQS